VRAGGADLAGRLRAALTEPEERPAVVVEALADSVAVDVTELLAEREEEVDVRGARARGELGAAARDEPPRVRRTSYGASIDSTVAISSSWEISGRRCSQCGGIWIDLPSCSGCSSM